MDGSGQSAAIDFGLPDVSRMQFNRYNATLAVKNDFFGSINVQAFAVSNGEDVDEFAFKPDFYSYFDSGTSKILVPPTVYPGLIKMLLDANGIIGQRTE